MSSPIPPDDNKKPGVRQTMQNTFRRAKDVVKRHAIPRQAPGQLEHPTSSSSRSIFQSLFSRSSPTLIARPRPSESDRSPNTPSRPPSTQGSDTNASANANATLRASESMAWTRLRISLRALESSVGLFPPLQSAIGSLIGCLDIIQVAASNREDYEDLAEEFRSMANLSTQYTDELAPEPSKGSVANIAQSIEQQVANINRKVNRGTIGRLLNATEDQEYVIRQYRQMDRLFRQLQCELSLRTTNQTRKLLETTLLKGLSPVDDAKYNSGYSTTVKRRGCTAKTREAIHRTLQDWTTNPDSETIYWMNGMAGTGKTTIAYTYCEWLESTNRLGASFFCSRISSSCRSLNQIVPTLAYQLAHFSRGLRSKLCSALSDTPDAGKLNVMQQFEALINKPVLDAKDAIPDNVVIVIDALDECDDSYSVRLLLDVLLKFADQLPLKFFVASRPEHVIRDRMVSQGGATRTIVHLHDIEQSIVEEDIKKYLIESFGPMSPPPSSEQITVLAKRSRNLFIYAATVVRYIYPGDIPVDSAKRLESMLKAISDPRAMANNKYEELDRLYTIVLSAVYDPRLDPEEKGNLNRVLWTVVCAKEPMTAATIASLACLDEHQVWPALQFLRSVIHVPEDNALISPLHASFPEYMLDESRSKEFYCNEAQSNERLVHRGFDIMKMELRFNICNLESSYKTDVQVEDLEARVAQLVSPTLSYACRHWSEHLMLAPPSTITRDMLSDFLSNRLLFWMEALNLCRRVGIGAPILLQAQTWLRQVEGTAEDIQNWVSDARNFVTWFAANPCSRSTPHIYISALPFCAKSNWVYQHYSKRLKGLGNIEMNHQDEAALAIWAVESSVTSIAISPDGNCVAAGTGDGSIKLYDINTGTIALTLKQHTNTVFSIAFTQDGALMASGSEDETVIIWDTHTGRILIGPLHQGAGPVASVAFSPDGKSLVSGSGDSAIRIWQVSNGATALGPLRGHSDGVLSVVFSADGRYIASGSGDFTIRLWDAFTSASATETLTGHTGAVHEVVFSPDGNLLASCSADKTIRIWDWTAGTAVSQSLEGHKGAVVSLAFSSDGTKLVSAGGTDDRSIIVWDTRTSSLVLGPLNGHASAVWAVAFSPDNARVFSGSGDSTIRIWDVLREGSNPDEGHSREISVGPVLFSADLTHFISCSSSGALHTWDMHTGTTIAPTFEGYEDLEPIHAIALSCQGKHVAAASDLGIYVWDALTGAMSSQPLTGHTGLVRCLAFSPSGTFLCSGSEDSTIIVWDLQKGKMIGQPYGEHAGSVHSVTCSSDGTRVQRH